MVTIAATKVANTAADGYTLLLATGGHAVAGAIYKQLAYETVDSFDMIGTITFFPFLIVANAEKGPRTLPALLDAARSGSDGVTYGSAGIGTTQHLTGELLANPNPKFTLGEGGPGLYVPWRVFQDPKA